MGGRPDPGNGLSSIALHTSLYPDGGRGGGFYWPRSRGWIGGSRSRLPGESLSPMEKIGWPSSQGLGKTGTSADKVPTCLRTEQPGGAQGLEVAFGRSRFPKGP